MRAKFAAGLTLAIALGAGTLTPALAVPHPSAARALIVVKAIDRDGHRQALTTPAVAMTISRFRHGAEYFADASGVIRAAPGRYLVGAEVVTPARAGRKESTTLIARVVRVASKKIVTLDARTGRRVSVSLLVPGSTFGGVGATLCGRGADERHPLASAVAQAGRIYVAASKSKDLWFSYASLWIGSDGTVYSLGGGRTGVPRVPRYAFRPADLSRLTLVAKAGAMEGTSGIWSMAALDDRHCGVELGDQLPATIPGKVSQFVSAGTWASGITVNGIDDDLVSITTRVTARRHYSAVIGKAVRGPGPTMLPRYLVNLPVTVSMLGLLSDPAGNANECSAHGSLTLRKHGRLVRSARFRRCNGAYVRLRLHRGWYDMSIQARRVAPSSSAPVAPLSRRVHLAWHFRVTDRDLQSVFGVPVSITRFVPSGLDMYNDARPGAVTPVRLTIFRGRPYPAYKIRSVTLQISFNDGRSWHMLHITGHRSRWLARVRNPDRGFVSLRSTVIDINGNSSVETINRAYGIASTVPGT